MTYDPLCELPPQQEPADMRRRGRAPMTADGRAQLGFAQGDVTGLGAAGRIGLFDAQRNGGRASLLTASGGIGVWNDESGRRTYGVNAEAAIARMGLPAGNGRPVGLEVGMGTAQAGAYANDSTLSLGAQANLLEVAGSHAGRMFGDDYSIRGGLSIGAGYGGRVHYGDEDGDGVPEMGLGFDVGSYSLDVRSETLGRAYNWARRQLGIGGRTQR